MKQSSQTGEKCEQRRTPLTILGVGNILCSDDGLGPAVVTRLGNEYEGDGVQILDGGTLGLTLLPILDDSDRMILVDAVRADDAPGSMIQLEGEDVLPAVRLRLSPHQVGVADLLDAARLRGTMPGRLLLIGLVPETIELGYGLSDPVDHAVPELIDAVIEQARNLGYPLEPRTETLASGASGASAAGGVLLRTG